MRQLSEREMGGSGKSLVGDTAQFALIDQDLLLVTIRISTQTVIRLDERLQVSFSALRLEMCRV